MKAPLKSETKTKTKTKSKPNSIIGSKSNPKSLVKLSKVADEDYETVDLFSFFSSDYCDGDIILYDFIYSDETKLKGRLADVSIVKSQIEGTDVKLLAVAATGETCEMFPCFGRPVFKPAEIAKLIASVDGWLVTTVDNAQLCLSVVRKKKWIAAGRPMVLDVS